MKKLMIAAAVAMVAVASQAAYFGWGTGKGGNVYLPGQAVNTYTGTAYLFASETDGDGAITLQSVIVEAFANNQDISAIAGLVDSSAVSAGVIAMKDTVEKGAFDFGAKGDLSKFYYALVYTDTTSGEKMLFVSQESASQSGPDGTKVQTFNISGKDASQALPVGAAGAGYKGAGWYTAVPEPTSGLLLLLGVAGLALRRRRA